jgi:hypothetical protein
MSKQLSIKTNNLPIKGYAVLLLLLFTSCVGKYRRIHFFHSINNNKRTKYILYIPKKYKQWNISNTEKESREKYYEYVDSSSIRISDIDYSLGETLKETKKRLQYEVNSIDTSIITFYGLADGRHYKEAIMTKNKIMVGYWNVPESKKKLFDKSIERFTRYLMRHPSKQ